MSNKEKIQALIEIVQLITKRCKKIEVDVIQQMSQLEKRIATLEAKK